MKRLGIIGLGLIGGSMAIDLRRKGFALQILGVEADPINAAAAEKIGLVDRVVSLDECIDQSDVIILSVPVGAAVKLLPEILDRFREECIDIKGFALECPAIPFIFHQIFTFFNDIQFHHTSGK